MASKRARQERLPGTEGVIQELEELGYEYAALRDQRMDLTKQEVDLKNRLLEAMHKNNLTSYQYQDIEVEIIPGEEKLKVKVDKIKDHDNEKE
jgi:hypothetical protein